MAAPPPSMKNSECAPVWLRLLVFWAVVSYSLVHRIQDHYEKVTLTKKLVFLLM